MNVLVVDDSRAMRALLRATLERNGHHVTAASHGEEALQCLSDDPELELAVVDWNMPVMDGISLIEAVRAEERYERLQIMMITTEVEMSQIQRALEAGANDYLMKPFEEAELLARILNLSAGDAA